MIGTDYNVIISDSAKQDLQKFTDYILKKYKDPFVVKNVMKDFVKTVERMRRFGDSQPILEIPSVRGKNLRVVSFKRYALKMFYEIHGDTIKIIRIKHERQDYYNML